MQKAKVWCIAIAGLVCGSSWADTTLTAIELKWLRAGWPVLTYAEAQALPIDIIVQPTTAAGTAPFAMAFANGRCQLVLSMRDNPEAEATLVDTPPELVNTAIEAMTAHEVAHCWRYVHGEWHTLPAGFVEAVNQQDNNSSLLQLQDDMRITRREEGFADLVGLAWTRRAHPQHYAAMLAWFTRIRSDQPITGSYHDTRVWIALAHDEAAFSHDDSPFEQVRQLWDAGLYQPTAQQTAQMALSQKSD